VSNLDQGLVRFGTCSKSDWKKHFYISHYSLTQVRDTSKWSKAKIKGIKLSVQRHLRFYDWTLCAPYREQKLQVGSTYSTLTYCNTCLKFCFPIEYYTLILQ
jgi:hypothetical protein